MEEFEYKLKQNSPVLILNTVKALIDKIKLLHLRDNKNELDKHVKFLKDKCLYGNNCVTKTATNGLIVLCTEGVLKIGTVLKDQLASISHVQNVNGLIQLIFYILENMDCKSYGIMTNQHPLITVLMKNDNVWPIILSYMYKTRLNKCLQPFVLYILYDYENKINETFQVEILELFHQHIDVNKIMIFSKKHLIRTGHYCKKLIQFDKAVSPYLALCVREMLKSDIDASETILTLKNHIVSETNQDFFTLELVILTDCIHLASVVDLFDILEICFHILDNNSYPINVINTFESSLIAWKLQFPVFDSCTLATHTLIADLFRKEFSKKIETNFTGKQPAYLNEYIYSALQNVRAQNLNLLLELQIEGVLTCFNQVLGVFYGSVSVEITLISLELLLRCVEKQHSKAALVLPVVLQKISNTKEPKVHLALVHALPKLAVLKEHLSTIVAIVKKLSGISGVMQTVTISVFHELFVLDTRCFPYLQELLGKENPENVAEDAITKAYVLKEICRKNVGLEVFGSEIAVYLSRILNMKHTNGLAQALAFEGLKYLCRHDIIDVSSAWYDVSPRFQNETNVLILKSLCELIGEIPNLGLEGSRYDKLVIEVITKLWDYIENNVNLVVIEAAFKALSYFKLEQMSGLIPSSFGPDCPDAYGNISGSTWIKVLGLCNRNALKSAGDLLVSLITSELKLYRRGVYEVSQGHGEPKCMSIPMHSVVAAVSTYVKTNVSMWKKDEELFIECLRVLSYQYKRPLPPLDWCFLHELADQPKMLEHLISIASHQVTLSGSSRRLMENFLTEISERNTFDQDVIYIYNNLIYLCNSIQPVIFKPFVERTLKIVLNAYLKGDQTHEEHIRIISKNLREVLQSKNASEANKTGISETVVYYVENVDHNHEAFNIMLSCVSVLPLKFLDDLSCPKQYVDVTSRIFERCLKMRCAACIETEENPLTYLDNFITCYNLKIEYSNELDPNVLFKEFFAQLKLVFTHHRNNSKCIDWLIELMAKIQFELADSKSIRRVFFMCTFFITAVSIISGYYVYEVHDATFKELFACFPYGLANLLKTKVFSSHVPQVLEWLHDVSTNSNYNTEDAEDLIRIFRSSLLVLRDEEAFNGKYKWMKYMEVEM